MFYYVMFNGKTVGTVVADGDVENALRLAIAKYHPDWNDTIEVVPRRR